MGTDELVIWTVYDHPSDSDMPYVARAWAITTTGAEATGDTFSAGSLDIVRRWLEWNGLHRLERDPDDDPVILETWV